MCFFRKWSYYHVVGGFVTPLLLIFKQENVLGVAVDFVVDILVPDVLVVELCGADARRNVLLEHFLDFAVALNVLGTDFFVDLWVFIAYALYDFLQPAFTVCANFGQVFFVLATALHLSDTQAFCVELILRDQY